MDSSQEYIRMCATPWIQGVWEFGVGDYFMAPFNSEAEYPELFIMDMYDNEGFGGVCVADDTRSIQNRIRAEAIWLPRQDQLQDMIGDYKRCSQFLAEYFSAMLDWRPFLGLEREEYWDNDLAIGISSMEQLWLMFAMREKYGKWWNSEKGEWVK